MAPSEQKQGGTGQVSVRGEGTSLAVEKGSMLAGRYRRLGWAAAGGYCASITELDQTRVLVHW